MASLSLEAKAGVDSNTIAPEAHKRRKLYSRRIACFRRAHVAIYYVHGFGSCSQANEKKRLEMVQIFPGTPVHMLDYNSSSLYIDNVGALVHEVSKTSKETPFFIGSSLGGLYARVLCSRYAGANCALFNPVIDPVSLLLGKVGRNINFCSGFPFEITEDVARSYSGYDGQISLHDHRMTVFVAIDDEILDPRGITHYFMGRAEIIQIQGGHRIPSLMPYAEQLVLAREPTA
jgi:predicted esterase YcpF (UPF0227 family)